MRKVHLAILVYHPGSCAPQLFVAQREEKLLRELFFPD